MHMAHMQQGSIARNPGTDALCQPEHIVVARINRYRLNKTRNDLQRHLGYAIEPVLKGLHK